MNWAAKRWKDHYLQFINAAIIHFYIRSGFEYSWRSGYEYSFSSGNEYSSRSGNKYSLSSGTFIWIAKNATKSSQNIVYNVLSRPEIALKWHSRELMLLTHWTHLFHVLHQHSFTFIHILLSHATWKTTQYKDKIQYCSNASIETGENINREKCI